MGLRRRIEKLEEKLSGFIRLDSDNASGVIFLTQREAVQMILDYLEVKVSSEKLTQNSDK